MTLIMDAFDGRNSRRTLEDIARFTRLPRSTAHRILDQLVRLGWLDHTSLGYCLGRRSLGLAGWDSGHGEIREAAAPVLHELQTRTGAVVHLAVLDGPDVFYLDKVGGRFATAVPSRVGGRVPAHAPGLGKAMLAHLEPEEIDARLGTRLKRLTPRTVGDTGTLHRELNRVRQRSGLAFERGECSPGIACVAATVHARQGPIAAISLVGDLNSPLETLAPLVSHAARRITRALGPDPESLAGVRHGDARPRRVQHQRVVGIPEQGWSAEAMDRLAAAQRSDDWL